MQVVAVGFIIGVIQDSVETALNSAGDVEFAATAEYTEWKKQGRKVELNGITKAISGSNSRPGYFCIENYSFSSTFTIRYPIPIWVWIY